jgi:hypothetical protein
MVIATCLTLVAGALYCSTSLTTFPTNSMPATGYPAGEWALFAKAYTGHRPWIFHNSAAGPTAHRFPSPDDCARRETALVFTVSL